MRRLVHLFGLWLGPALVHGQVHVFGARHLPKMDRAGMANAFVEIGMADPAHRFAGHCKVGPRAPPPPSSAPRAARYDAQ